MRAQKSFITSYVLVFLAIYFMVHSTINPKRDLSECECLAGNKNFAPILYVQPGLPPDKDRQMGIQNIHINFNHLGLLLRGVYCDIDISRE